MEPTEKYVDKAKENIASFLDGMVNTCQYLIKDAWIMFLKSRVSLQFERKQYEKIAKQTVEELTNNILKDNKVSDRVEKIHTIANSKEYWAGWVVAWYQETTGLRFAEITKPMNIVEIMKLHKMYEDQPLQKVKAKIDKVRKQRTVGTNLKLCREMAGLTQPELSDRSQVPYKELQKYEQGRKDINKAPREMLDRLAKVLSCKIEDMYETPLE